MRVLIQRVNHASCKVNGEYTGKIEKGYLLFVGITHDDNEKIIELMADKVINLRINEDENEKMNLSLKDINGELLVVSQFTLYGDCRKGRRPNFTNAAKPDLANELYEEFIEKASKQNIKVGTGKFGANMMVELTNEGPVTILIDSERTF